MNNKSIFNYVMDRSRFENANSCVDFRPPFGLSRQHVVPGQNIDVENALRGANRQLSKCKRMTDVDISATKNLQECVRK